MPWSTTDRIRWSPHPRCAAADRIARRQSLDSSVGSSLRLTVATWVHQYLIVVDNNASYWFSMVNDGWTWLIMVDHGSISVVDIYSRNQGWQTTTTTTIIIVIVIMIITIMMIIYIYIYVHIYIYIVCIYIYICTYALMNHCVYNQQQWLICWYQQPEIIIGMHNSEWVLANGHGSSPKWPN